MRDAALTLPLAAYGQPVRRLNPPVLVRVWVPRGHCGWVQLDGTANAYTAVAAHVEYVDEQGRVGHVWVWAGAVERV